MHLIHVKWSTIERRTLARTTRIFVGRRLYGSELVLIKEILGSRIELGKGLVSRSIECVAIVTKATLALGRQQEGFTQEITFFLMFSIGYLPNFFFFLAFGSKVGYRYHRCYSRRLLNTRCLCPI